MPEFDDLVIKELKLQIDFLLKEIKRRDESLDGFRDLIKKFHEENYKLQERVRVLEVCGAREE